MKPRNKKEKLIVEYSKELPSMTYKQREWAIKVSSQYYLFTRYTSNVCSKCNYRWKATIKGKTTKCPNCGVSLQVNKNYFKDRYLIIENYITIIDTHKGYQVERIFYFSMHLSSKFRPMINIFEVIQHWIDDKGVITTLMHPTQRSYEVRWTIMGKLELRTYSSMYQVKMTIKGNDTYPKIKVLPIVKRNGFRTSFYGLSPHDFVKEILTDTKMETLLKTKQIKLFKQFVNHGKSDTYWKSIKVAHKNNYVPDNFSDWFDYLSMLDIFNKDIQNPKYICPENLHKEHQRYIRKHRDLLKNQKREELRTQIEENQTLYKEAKKDYIGKEIAKGNLSIKVMDSVNQFFEVGENMNHCIFNNAYYSKKDSLILLAKRGEVELETIEVSIPNRFVIQSRGLNNLNTPDHEEIVALVNNNINQLI